MIIIRRDGPKNSIKHSESFEFKSKFLKNSINAVVANVEIAVPLK